MEVIISKSRKNDKKFDAVIDGKKTISFGQKHASDYTIHKDLDRKERYINRHKKNENWNDPRTAGFYAKHILWNKLTIEKSIADTNKQFPNIKIKLK